MIRLGLTYSFIKYARSFRKTTVEINGVKSEDFYLNKGLPQGSAISPLLFLLFINDTMEFMTQGAAPSLFANDTSAVMIRKRQCKRCRTTKMASKSGQRSVR